MAVHPPKKFRLSFVNAAEDVPRVVSAYGRCCNGEVALVLRPTEERGVMVHIGKDGAFFWRSGDAPADGRRRVPAEVVRASDGSLRLAPMTAGSGGVTWRPYDTKGLRAGQKVTIAFHPDDQFAHVVTDQAHSDAPARPATAVSAADAVALARTEQKAVPKPGPITLRGQWSGTLTCVDGQPVVQLVRKLAAYGVLTITSSPDGGWRWSVARHEKWFSKPGSDKGSAPTLLAAIEGGLARAMGLIGEACSVRDSRRRAALDTTWAAERPIRPAKEGRDPIDRLKVKEPRRRKARAQAAPAADPKATEPAKPKRKPRVKADAPAPRRRAAASKATAVEPAPDPAKDKALIDAFSAAVAAAMGSA